MLPTRDRAILHLYGLRGEQIRDQPSDASTQEGIASALGLNRTHVTRTLTPLVQAGLMEQEKGRVTGKERRLIYYRLTPAGLERAAEIIKELTPDTIDVIDDRGRRTVGFRELLTQRPDIPPLGIADAIGGEMRLPPASRVVISNATLGVSEFIDREEQLQAASQFMESSSTVLAIFASYGYGSSTFLKRIATSLWDGHLFWHDLEKDPSSEGLRAALSVFAHRLGLEGEPKRVREVGALLCFDNYHAVSQEVVDVLYDLNRSLKGGKARLAVAIRGETPSYNRFYLKQDVTDGTVVEVTFHRFGERDSRRLLGLDVSDETFQQIYLMTRGQPLALALLRDGDEAALKKIRPNEEARFMMYLRGRAVQESNGSQNDKGTDKGKAGR
ncbi:MAG: hypothetical protein LUO79_07565 [Methanomassiliicoccales archaeon]|nr:hypothetical protein [Methanomassiliicoccales archaeon]